MTKDKDITPEHIYRQRRRFVAGAAMAVGAAWMVGRYGGRNYKAKKPENPEQTSSVFGKTNEQAVQIQEELAQIAPPPYPPPPQPVPPPPPMKNKMKNQGPNPFLLPLIADRKRDTADAGDVVTPLSIATSYNNFYEFGTDKHDPELRASQLTVDPWSVLIDGLCHKGGVYDLERIARVAGLEERVYRLRCVEAWSMVIPWIGFSLSHLLKLAEPMGSARYVAFQTLYRPEEMPAQKSLFSTIQYPYVEGLRMDEAMHPLTLLTLGMYGERMYPQNGAPVKIIVPWKYGFKSPKSVVRITFTEREPPATWNISAPREYGFYSNVNPNRSHPRWSQRWERRFTDRTGFNNTDRIPTQPFNGYGEEVAHLYAGMDLINTFY